MNIDESLNESNMDERLETFKGLRELLFRIIMDRLPDATLTVQKKTGK